MFRRSIASGLFAVTVLAAAPALAFECPRHLAAAEARIAEVAKAVEASGAAAADKALVHALLDDARMLLTGARHNHEKPQGKYDHARALAKADSALAHAEAAAMLLARIGG